MKERLLSLVLGLLLIAGVPFMAMAGPAPGGADTDGDTVEDAFDNCTLVSNAGQDDADHDACGDACPASPANPADITGDTQVGVPDYTALVGNWGGTTGGASDITGDTQVGVPDYTALVGSWGSSYSLQNGPSGITNSSRDFGTCPL
jgi:hypothetical protein